MTSVYLRVALYVLSTVLTTYAGLLAGFGVSFDAATNVLSIQLETLLGALLAAFGISGAIFAKWGVK